MTVDRSLQIPSFHPFCLKKVEEKLAKGVSEIK